VDFDVTDTVQIFCIRQVLEKKREYNGAVDRHLEILRKPMTQSREKHYTLFSLNVIYLRNRLGY
jgi:hypothetical protein